MMTPLWRCQGHVKSRRPHEIPRFPVPRIGGCRSNVMRGSADTGLSLGWRGKTVSCHAPFSKSRPPFNFRIVASGVRDSRWAGPEGVWRCSRSGEPA